MAAVRHGGRPMVRAGTEDVESLHQPQGQGCLDDVDLSILLEDAGPATEAFDAVQLKWSSASARVSRFPSADATVDYQDYARLANRFLGNNWVQGEAIHVALKTKHDRRQVLDALDCPKEDEAKKQRKTLVCRVINTITLGHVVVPVHSTLSLRKWRRLKTLPQSVWERRPVKPVRLIFTLVAQHQLNQKLSVRPHSLGGRLNYLLRLSFKNTEASPGKDADLVKVVQAWRQRCSTKTKTKTDRLHARSHYFQLDVMFWAWSADGQHLNRPGKTIPSTSIVNRHGQMPVANFMGKKIPVPHNPLSFLKRPERYGKDGLLCPSGTKAGMPSYLWHNNCGVHCPPGYQKIKHGSSGGVFVPPRPEHVGIADVFNFNVGRSSAALTVDERWRTWLLTSSTVDEATFAANVSPQLSLLQRATHLLARHLLHQFPSFSLKGGYPRDVVIGNKHPNDLDFFLNTKKNPTAAHQVFEMADEIKQWSQNHGLFAEAPFCLQIARGCRGLHLIVCTTSPAHKSGGKRSASCEHTNKVISIELTVISPWLPFFAANGLALQSDQGLTTVDPKRLAVMTAVTDSRSRTLRQVAHSSKEFLYRRSKFMRRGWRLASPNDADADEFEDKEKLLAAESLKPDLRAMFPEMSAVALVDETIRPEFVARWRRLQSNDDFSRTNVCQLGEEPIWIGGEPEDCMTCAPGKYQDHKNNKFWGPCKTCATGLYTNGSHPDNHASVDDCLTCPEGKRFSNTPFRDCISCSVGQYQPQNGVASVTCKTCPAGWYADQLMMTSCTACPAGRFNPTAGQATDHDALGDCNICSYGKYADADGSTQCKECNPGYFLTDDGVSANEHVASSDCKACAAGWSAPTPATDMCSSCPAGKYAPASTVSCTVCTSGQYSDKAPNDAYGCLECPLGRIGAPGTDISSHDHADDCSGTQAFLHFFLISPSSCFYFF